MAEPFIATKKIFYGTALAHDVGDEVPAENVRLNGWEDSVSRASSKAAKEAQAPVDTAPPEGDALGASGPSARASK